MTKEKDELIVPVQFEKDIDEEPKPKKKLIVPYEIVEEGGIDPATQVYIILYLGSDDNDGIKSYDVVKGRTQAYEHVKNLAPDIDCLNSRILSDGVGFDEAISIYSFMKLMEQYFSDGFDITDYVDTDVDIETDMAENSGLIIDM